MLSVSFEIPLQIQLPVGVDPSQIQIGISIGQPVISTCEPWAEQRRLEEQRRIEEQRRLELRRIETQRQIRENNARIEAERQRRLEIERQELERQNRIRTYRFNEINGTVDWAREGF